MKFQVGFIFIKGGSALEHQEYTNYPILVVKFRLAGSILTRPKLFPAGSVSIGRPPYKEGKRTDVLNDTVAYNLLIFFILIRQ